MSGGYKQPDGTVIAERTQDTAPAPVPETSVCGKAQKENTIPVTPVTTNEEVVN